MRKTIMAALLALTLCAGCSFVEERESQAELVTKYATLKVIKGDPARADRVEDVASEVLRFVDNSTPSTVEALISFVRAEIRWDKLDEADALLVEALLIEVKYQLKALVCDDEANLNECEDFIPADLKITTQKIARWVVEAAQTI